MRNTMSPLFLLFFCPIFNVSADILNSNRDSRKEGASKGDPNYLRSRNVETSNGSLNELGTRNSGIGKGEPGKVNVHVHVKNPKDGGAGSNKVCKIDKCRICAKCKVEDCFCYVGKISVLGQLILIEMKNVF